MKKKEQNQGDKIEILSCNDWICLVLYNKTFKIIINATQPYVIITTN